MTLWQKLIQFQSEEKKEEILLRILVIQKSQFSQKEFSSVI